MLLVFGMCTLLAGGNGISGAMATDKYLHVQYHQTVKAFTQRDE